MGERGGRVGDSPHSAADEAAAKIGAGTAKLAVPTVSEDPNGPTVATADNRGWIDRRERVEFRLGLGGRMSLGVEMGWQIVQNRRN